MANILLVYWSGTGNTEIMAEKIKEGLEGQGSTVDFKTVDQVEPDDVSSYDKVVFGCPSMGVEQLEEFEFEPFYGGIKDGLSGKKVVLFGSYGWGDGEWMRVWEDDVRATGATLVDAGLIVNETPDDEANKMANALGQALVKA